MSELFEKSIRVLELPRLLEMLEHHAVSAEAKARARRLTPSDDFGEVNRLLDETDAARKMIMLRGSPAFGGVRDVGEALSRAERFAAASGYAVAATPYASGHAGYKDWFLQDFRRPGFTIEAGSGENPLPLSQFPDIWSDNLGILLGGMAAVL